MLTEERRAAAEDVLKTFEGLNAINKALLYAYGCGLLDAQKAKEKPMTGEESGEEEKKED